MVMLFAIIVPIIGVRLGLWWASRRLLAESRRLIRAVYGRDDPSSA